MPVPRAASERLHPMSDLPGGGGGGGGGGEEPKPKIQVFGQTMGAAKREETWKRKPNADGSGATHVRSFHCKLSDESLAFMDQQINSWLDEHPELEVKFITSNVGEWTGKIKEPALIVSVWV